uniref:NADH dehydrogenase subunit 6 n=2 Tax=Panagrolaimus sp. PS1159 TaxID=55785 RepID=A0AC35FIT8_9BILA
MDFSSKCCGIHIKKLARAVAIVGAILSCISFCLIIFSWNYLPMTISLLLAFLLALIGLRKINPKYLLIAIAILGINIFVAVLLLINAIWIGITVPQEYVKNYRQQQFYINLGSAEKELQTSYFVYASFLAVVSAILTFSFVIFYKARNYMLQNPGRC